jgi:hypothetical protein
VSMNGSQNFVGLTEILQLKGVNWADSVGFGLDEIGLEGSLSSHGSGRFESSYVSRHLILTVFHLSC